MSIAQEVDQHFRSIRRTLRQFSQGGLTLPQRSVMHALASLGGLSMKELSSQVGLAHSTVSGIVDRLERQGLVERQTDKQDHRISRIVASKAALGLVVHPLTEAFRRAKPAERRAIVEGLRTLRRLLE
jgi:DNA-binding MarR family transcriptional regulator